METCIKHNLSKPDSDSESDIFDEFIDDISDFVNNEENADNCFRNIVIKIRSLLYKLANNL
tara:strand:+ start:351 stop:533 length:183 start_codon:yes stop_codon:yes gene_type:complete